MNLLISLRSEILKTKRTAAFYLAIAAGAFGPMMSMLDIFLDGIEPSAREIILNIMFTDKFQMTGLMMLPIFLVLICTLLPQIEYKNHAWKQVLASPQTKGNIFVSKFVNIHLLILVFLATNQLMMFLAAVILHFKEPSLHVLSQPFNSGAAVMTVVNSYIAILAMSAIQFWLGLRLKNFIAPIAIGIASWFIGTILVMQVKGGFAEFFPYSFPAFSNFPKNPPPITVHWTSVAYAAAFLVIGFVDFRRMEKR